MGPLMHAHCRSVSQSAGPNVGRGRGGPIHTGKQRARCIGTLIRPLRDGNARLEMLFRS